VGNIEGWNEIKQITLRLLGLCSAVTSFWTGAV